MYILTYFTGQKNYFQFNSRVYYCTYERQNMISVYQLNMCMSKQCKSTINHFNFSLHNNTLYFELSFMWMISKIVYKSFLVIPNTIYKFGAVTVHYKINMLSNLSCCYHSSGDIQYNLTPRIYFLHKITIVLVHYKINMLSYFSCAEI